VETLEDFIELALCSIVCGALFCLFLTKKFLIPSDSSVFMLENSSFYEESLDNEQLLNEDYKNLEY